MNTSSKDVPELDTEATFSSLKGNHAARRAMDYYLKPTISGSDKEEKFFEIRHSLSSEEAMIHASDLLRCAAATAYDAANNLRGANRDLAFSVVHMIDLAKALVDKSLESQRQESS
ncbi:DUF3077 domain-containing protein [Pseudomonas sp. Fl5BN2]|uniref:DUF6124 family protein n=1 Tax=unclassified Pseudomonas TaxID=196821 RepID=UPI00137860A3|nr:MULTISPECIES: DUF3077 domain-containing protein [unclassified Pseudomonas]NBF04193.1 DUF3077 domain-containing protein [Pseudomonas sp. Fl5BN2]NBF09922.1 DUF3077 domain-containing protein [Pseudomonas sp. Fl4BN1]